MEEARKSNVSYVELTERQCKILEKRNGEKKALYETRSRLNSVLQQINNDIIKVEGKEEALVEMIAEENGIDVEEIGGSSWDTNKKQIVFTLKPSEVLPGLKLVEPEEPPHEHEENGDKPVKPEDEKKEEVVANGSDRPN